MGDSPFELRVFCVEVRTKFRRPAQVRSRREDAEAARTAGQAERVNGVRGLAGLGDDTEHVLGGELEHWQPVKDLPSGDAHALAAAPGDAPRTVAALVAANPEGVDEPARESGMGLEVAAQLALDGSAFVLRRTPSLADPGEHTPLADPVEQRLAGGDGREYQRHAGRQRRLDMLDRARPFDLAERGVNGHELGARNDTGQQDRHRL